MMATAAAKPKRRAARPATPERIEHLSVDQRMALGKAARARVPRKDHALWAPPAGRDDPVDILERQATTRVPELAPIRYGRMLVSPFAFYRGAAAVMAADLSYGPHTSLRVQLCGDAHLSNFGVYAAPDRRLVFDINDFDETAPGPFEWDLKRLCASFEIACRMRGFARRQRRDIVMTLTAGYREAMRGFARARTFDVWYSRIEVDVAAQELQTRVGAAARRRFDRNLAKARSKDTLAAFRKLTHVVDGEPRFIAQPPLIVPIRELFSNLNEDDLMERAHVLLRSYRRTLPDDRRHLLERFRIVDGARKVVGVGSVGTRAYMFLLVGRDNDDPLILQVKEAEASVLEAYAGKSKFSTHGERVVQGQRLMQAASDTMLGWLRTPGIDDVPRDFYFRQLWDAKGSALVEELEPLSMKIYAQACAQVLARAHARSGDAVALAAYMGSSDTFDRALTAFAEAYADQTDHDYATLVDAARTGAIEVQEGI